MSRKGFAVFSILFPVCLAAFMLYIARVSGGMETGMERFAAGLILFFSGVSWSIVRSNRTSPARLDLPSLLFSVAALLVFMSLSAANLSKHAGVKQDASARSAGVGVHP